MNRTRRLQQQARSRLKRRRAADGPWYDKKQVKLEPAQRALQRLYWMANKRLQRADKSLGVESLKLAFIVWDVRILMHKSRRGLVPNLNTKVRELRDQLLSTRGAHHGTNR